MGKPLRPQKVIRLNYIKNKPNQNMAAVTIFGDPAEVRMGVNAKTFISVNDTAGITLSPGIGNQVNIQAMPQNFRFGGMLMDLPFPLSIFPTTPFTPFPKQLFVPPLLEVMPLLVQISSLAALFPG